MRNYKKENEWKKKKYVLIQASIEKELGLKLKEKLKLTEKTIVSWIRENAIDFVTKM